jgi:AraC-like DNA-binding protein
MQMKATVTPQVGLAQAPESARLPAPPLHRDDQRVYPAHVIEVLVRVLADEGVAPARSLQHSGIDEGLLSHPGLRVSERQWLSVFESALALSNDPALAFRAGSRMHVAACGIYGYALLSSPTHADVIDFAAKYNRMISPFAAMRFTRDGERAVWVIEPTLDAAPPDAMYRFALELKLMTMLTVMRDLYGADFSLAGIRVVHAAPSNSADYARWLGCDVSFGQDANELWFDSSRLAQRMPYANMITHGTMRELCDQALVKIPREEGLIGTVHAMLVEQPGRFPDLDAMASALAMSSRTLRRRLDAEGKSYREILTDVRQRLAISYLRTTDLTSEEIAIRLGYSEPASFRHAFTRWTNSSPGEYRRRHAGGR